MPKLRYPTDNPPPRPSVRAFAPVSALLTALIAITAAAGALAAVPVQINSGDPAFPFPQFLPYEHANGDVLYNLGTNNPAGVTHAEMEKSIRDAYQIMMNRASYYQNIALNGVKYIKFASNPDCSEGTGYAMLAAAMMADKTTFDGLWLFTHDFAMNKVVRYRDGSNAPQYPYSVLPGWTNAAGGNSAADGDFDIALALMIAHKQWGEFMGVNDSRGGKISYKADFLKVIKGLSDTLSFSANGNLLSGDIGFDGYIKGGDSWTELTGWAQNMQNLFSVGISKRAETVGPAAQHIDYAAPAYFRQFADYMQAENANAYAWNISQFRRAEASSDWLIGKLISQNPKNIPVAGWVEMKNDTAPAFSTFSDGEDFRAAWRTVLNYVWHGNPVYTWDPIGRSVLRNRTNTFQRDAGQRFAKFLWDRRQTPWNDTCEKILGEGSWWGPSMLKYHYSPDGRALTVYPLNWIHGTGSPSAVTAQDTNLMAEMYRQAEIEWDVETPGDRYLTSTPQYFHGFFRLLGMNVLTGNHHAPMNMKKSANMKVYLDVDKTYAFEDDTITYTIDYRNYGADEAKGVRIVNRLHKDFVFISGTGSPSYDAASNTVSWNIGSVPGFKTSAGVNPTKGTVTLKVKIPNAKLKRYENKVTVSCTNGSGWTSNEYPNKISSVMKRNGVDIASRALRVNHSVYRDTVNPGMTATYTIEFENSADAGWLNGGRPGVNFSYAHNGTAASAGSHTFMIRAFNDAHEAYIDYGNYRVSYFLSDVHRGTGPNGWNYRTDILYVPDAEASKFKFEAKDETPGEDSKGKWNQRLILQIADVKDPSRTDTNWGTMAAPTQFLINYSGLTQRVHRGISTPFKGVWAVYAGNYMNRDWGGDWSYNARASGTIGNDAMTSWGYPVTPDFTESPAGDNIGKPVKRLHRKLCGPEASVTVDNILIEEWDGYTWRRVFGNGPLPGREVSNVVIRDTLPAGVKFIAFKEPSVLGVAPKVSESVSGGVTVVTWEISKLTVNQSGKIQYSVSVDTALGAGNKVMQSRAWAAADNESPTQSTAVLVVTRDSLPPPPPEPTTMYKRANKTAYSPGDTAVYTIAYKQTHGYPVKSGSSGEWTPVTAGGAKPVSADGDTVTLANPVNVYHNLSYGTNGSIGGTANFQSDQEFYLFARSDNNNKKVELYLKVEWDGLHVKINSNGKETVVSNPFTVDKTLMAFKYKIVFRADSLFLWIDDTSSAIPQYKTGGIDVQAGYAGIRYTKDYGSAKIVGWNSRFDLAYNVTIRDTVPFGVRYIEGSAVGAINTGTLAPKQLTGGVNGNVIAWPVVSGSGAANALGANDSLTVTWRGIVDTSKTGSVVNTAYTEIAGYPKNAVGAQIRSKFSLVKGPDDPDPPDPPQGELTLRVAPPGYPDACMFAGSVNVTLSPSRSGAVVWYTLNGQTPDSASLASRRYTGQPLEFETFATLRAVAYAEGCEPVFTDEHKYAPINNVPIRSAIFYDDVGDGLAHGVKLVISPSWRDVFDPLLVKAHPELLSFTGNGMPKTVDSLRIIAGGAGGDTIKIPFGKGVDPQGSNAKLVVSDPPLSDSRYAVKDGYLAACELNIVDGVVPIIVKAVYYVESDILAVTFNKLPGVYSDADTAVRLTPFTLSHYGWADPYELEFRVAPRQEGNTYYFVIAGITGDMPPGGAPSEGDSIRVKVGENVKGIWQKDPAIVQTNVNNTAAALTVKYPDFKHAVKIGPNPSRDTVRIFVSLALKDTARNTSKLTAYGKSALESSRLKAVIFDMTGSVVTVIESEAGKDSDGERRVLVWDGRNSKGRKAGIGTYRILVTITGQDGGKETKKNKVYITGGKGK